MNRTLSTIGLLAMLIGIAIWYFSSVFVYIIISLVLSTVLRPLTNRISRVKLLDGSIPRSIAVLSSFIVVICVISLFVILFIPLISAQIEVIAHINFEETFYSLTQPIKSFEQFLINKRLTEMEPGFLVEGMRSGITNFIRSVDFSQILNHLISFTGNFFVGTLAVVFITFFLLYEDGIIRRQLISVIPNQYFEVFISALYKMERLLSNYLLGLLFQMFSIFSIAAIGLAVVGVKYAVTIAVFAAVANLIPYMGPLLGAAFGIIVAISTSGDFTFSNDTILLVVKVMAVFGTVQAIDNIFLQPLIFSKSVKAHPLEIFVIIFVGATIAGIPGMIGAIPVYTVIKVSSTEIYAGFNQYKVFKSKN